jgi:hypothetical protein
MPSMCTFGASRDSAVGIATACELDDREVGVRVPMSSRPALGSTQPPIQSVPGVLSPRVTIPRTPSWRSAKLVKHRDNFTFYVSVHSRLNIVVFLHCHYKFRPNRPSSGVQVVIKGSAAHCNAVFFVLFGCLGLLRLCRLTICINFGVLELQVFVLPVLY